MAINMMNEADYISCPKCNNITFREEETFTIKKTKVNKETFLKTQSVDKAWLCIKCGTDVTQQIKQYEMM